MDSSEKTDTPSQVVNPVANVTGKVRVKPRHLSPLLRQVIVDNFRACHSTEDVAEQLRIPVRTVTDVLLLEQMRRPLQPDRAIGITRRMA